MLYFQPPVEKNLNDDIVHYWDLLPFINVTRVINHLVSVMPQVANVTVNHLLQPSVATTHTILLLLFNFMLFNEQQLESIAEDENELFNFANMVSIVILLLINRYYLQSFKVFFTLKVD